MANYVPAIAEDFMSKADCERVMAAADAAGFEPASVHSQEGHVYDDDLRSAEFAVLRPEAHRDLYDLAGAAIAQVNNEQFRFNLAGLAPIQVMRYTEGSFFNEHYDVWQDSGGQRKVTLVVQLSSEESYEGGQLVLFGDQLMPNTQGAACVFPSWLSHRVETLTAGTRYTFVAWAKGPPFT
jgi:PKHD-type hydroxylase